MENNDYSNGTSCPRVPICSHLLQESLRRVCEDQRWIYSVFWRILPRNFPPPKWELGGYLDRSKANKRNWILVWEDGFCDFARVNNNGGSIAPIPPDLFFKMSHEVYNYGEGLMGKVSADNGHKWVYRDPPKSDHTPSWQTSIDPQPRTWDSQFKSGIQTIVVISVCEGVVQLGSTEKIQEDHDFVTLLQRKFNNLLMTLPSVSLMAIGGGQGLSKIDHKPTNTSKHLERQPSWNKSTLEKPISWNEPTILNEEWSNSCHMNPNITLLPIVSGDYNSRIMPSMNSLEALLSKLPSVTSDQHVPNNIPYNGNSSLASHSSRTLNAPFSDYWLQEPPISSITSIPPPLLAKSYLNRQHNHGNTFVIAESSSEYSYLGDSID